MKKLFFCLFVIAFCLGSVNAGAQNNNGQTPVEIVVTISGPYGNGPRVPAVIPISGIATNDTIYLFFSTDLGSVDLLVEELSAGMILHTVVNGSYPMAMIPYDGEPGSYTITFTLANGSELTGSFVI